MQKTLTTQDLSAGQALPDLDIPITATLVAGGAIASRDYTPVHHSRSEAVAQGLPDMFMNILTTQGLCSRYVTDWAGPDPTFLFPKLQTSDLCECLLPYDS